MWRTRFSTMFGLEHPIMSAPMVAHSGATLAAAVSAAGALGSFAGMHPTRGPGWVDEEIAAVRSVTDRPFAVGFITAFLPYAEEEFEVTLARRPDAISLSFGDPMPWAGRVKDAGIRLICQVQTPADAEEAVAAGADVLAVQGTEAGGHTGTLGLMPFLSSVVRSWPDTPVLAAGGIADGRSVAAALTAGADGVWMGTAFLATDEAVEVDDAYKQLIVDSDGTDTVLTQVYDIASGLPWPETIYDRVRGNRFTMQWTGREEELARRRGEDEIAAAVAPASFDPAVAAVRYGQAAGAIAAVRPAADVVRDISEEAAQVLDRRLSSLTG